MPLIHEELDSEMIAWPLEERLSMLHQKSSFKDIKSASSGRHHDGPSSRTDGSQKSLPFEGDQNYHDRSTKMSICVWAMLQKSSHQFIKEYSLIGVRQQSHDDFKCLHEIEH